MTYDSFEEYSFIYIVFFHEGSFIISNIFCYIFLLKLSYPIEKLFLLPAWFELRTLQLVSDADTLTNWAIAHLEFEIVLRKLVTIDVQLTNKGLWQ